MAILHMQLGEIARLEWTDMVWYHERARVYKESERAFYAYQGPAAAPTYPDETWEG